MKTFMLLTLLGAARGACPAFDAAGATPERKLTGMMAGGYGEWAVADDALEKELGSAVDDIKVTVAKEFSTMQAKGANVAARVCEF